MRIALINENSQAAKNSLIEATLKKVVEPMGHTVVNYGMYTADDACQLTYVKVGLLASLLLAATPINEEPLEEKSSSVMECVRLLARPIVLLSFIGIICHVGIDVGTNTTAPKILIERHEMSLNDAAFATSLYFIFRTLGCLSGSWLLRVVSNRLFFTLSVGMMALAMVGLGLATAKPILYASIALVGYGNSNIFSLVFAQALRSDVTKQNEISGLMIMGLFGGTLFPLLMGFAGDALGQAGAVLVMALGVLYLFTYISKIQKNS